MSPSKQGKQGGRNHNTITAPTIEPISNVPALTTRCSQLGNAADNMSAEELWSSEVWRELVADEEAEVPVV